MRIFALAASVASFSECVEKETAGRSDAFAEAVAYTSLRPPDRDICFLNANP